MYLDNESLRTPQLFILPLLDISLRILIDNILIKND